MAGDLEEAKALIGLYTGGSTQMAVNIATALANARMAEREACAKVAETRVTHWQSRRPGDGALANACEGEALGILKAIRALGVGT